MFYSMVSCFVFKAFDDMRQAVKKKFTVIRQHRNRTGESPIDIALNEADQYKGMR